MTTLIEVCITVNQVEVRLLFDSEPRLEHIVDAITHVFAENEHVRDGICGLIATLGDSDLILHVGAEAYFEQDENRIGNLIVQPRTLFEVS